MASIRSGIGGWTHEPPRETFYPRGTARSPTPVRPRTIALQRRVDAAAH